MSQANIFIVTGGLEMLHDLHAKPRLHQGAPIHTNISERQHHETSQTASAAIETFSNTSISRVA